MPICLLFTNNNITNQSVLKPFFYFLFQHFIPITQRKLSAPCNVQGSAPLMQTYLIAEIDRILLLRRSHNEQVNESGVRS